MNSNSVNPLLIILLLLLSITIVYSDEMENRKEFVIKGKAFADCHVISLETMEHISFDNPKYKSLAEFLCSEELEKLRKEKYE